MDKQKIEFSKQSGQRSGMDRRKTTIPIEKQDDRRSGSDRRCKWPLINEWCSPMNRGNNS